MNVPDESGWNSSLRHPDQPKFGGEAHYAHGLLQEGGDEWNNYQSWMKQNAPNGNWRDPALQGQFTAWNLKNNYPDLWDKMNNAKTPGEAAAQFVKGYLKPAQQFQVARANKYLGSDGDETLPSGATPVSYSGNTRYAQNDTGTMSDANPYQMPQGQQPYPDALKRDWGQNLARSPWMSLVRAGAAMASTTGPVGTAIAHGMAAGAGELDTQRKSLQTEEGVNLKAQQLYQQAKQHLDQYTRMTPYQAQEAAKPVIVAQTVDAYGRTHATYGQRQPDGTFVDPITQKPIDQKTISGQTSGPDPTTLSGDEYLKTLPPGLANTVKQIANGDVGINNVGYRDRTAVLGAVSQYDPSFNTYTAPMRAQAAKNYTGSGVEARNFTSNDMAIKHIGTGLSNIEALHNSTYPMYNAIANPLARNVGNTQVQSALTGLKTDIDAVGSELMRSFRGSGSASEREATEWRSNFPINGSPVEQRRAFQEAANLLAGRITAAGHRYNDAMGPMHSRDPLSWLSPEGRAIINYTTNQLDPQKPIPPNFKQLGSQSQGNAPSQAQPSQSDIDYVRAHPEVKDKFIQRFGREP
jgi:hypothetical protein